MLFVILSHWGPFYQPGTFGYKIMKEVLPTGEFGVGLFFVISGYLITSILLQAREKSELSGTGKTTIIKSFFLRRALRIFPVYYLTLVVLYLLGNQYVVDKIGYYLLYLGNFIPFWENKPNPLIHFWSLAVEEQFYLILPWVVLYVNKRYLKQVFIGAIIIALLSKYIVLFVMGKPFAMLVINWFDGFGLGGLYAVMKREGKERQFNRNYVFIFICVLYLAWRFTPFIGTPLGIIFIRFTDLLIGLAMMIFVLNSKSHFLNKYIFGSSILVFIGRISYGLYVYHYVMEPPIQNFMDNYLSAHKDLPAFCYNFYFTYLLKYVVVFTASVVSFYAMEQPLLQLKNKFNYNR